MYQDKIEQEAKKAVASENKQARFHNIFENSKLMPLDFIPDEDVCDATHIARDILSKRSNEEVITLSKGIDSMLVIGDRLFNDLAIQLLDSSDSRTSVVMAKGRSLYLLCDSFDLSKLTIKKVQWSEVFATLTLMQSAEIIDLSSEKNSPDEFYREELIQTTKYCINQLKGEIIDSIARAECLFDKSKKSAKQGSSGGNAKAQHMKPLRDEVIKRYVNHYTGYSYKKAGAIIEAELNNESPDLMLLSSAEEKNLQFAKWISSYVRSLR